MLLVSKTYWAGAPFNFRRPPANAAVESRVLRAADGRESRALYWTPASRPRPRVAVVAMHPRVDFTHHYSFPRLVEAGIGCLGANTRHPNNDTTTEHEEIVLDVAACVRWLREHRGASTIILLGNSGGGSLSALFQAQARKPPAERIITSPGGARTFLPVADLLPADAMIYIAAHRGQGAVLGECIDPSVIDERDPHATDPALDMYHPQNGFHPAPAWSEYDPAFVARFREAQRARVARLDALARAQIEELGDAERRMKDPDFESLPFPDRQRVERRAAFEPVMVVYRTMANLNYVDRRLDPSPREYGSLLSERPDLMNMAYLGFARTVTPRAWLSTWSAISSNADLVKNLAQIQDPTLMIQAGADREIYPRTDVAALEGAIAAPDRTCVTIEGARHYFEPPEPGKKDAPDVERVMDIVLRWIRERFEV